MKITAVQAYSLSALASIILGFHGFFDPFGRDQGIHATIAYALDEGLITYRDVFNMKPPLTTVFHWAALKAFGHSISSIRFLDFFAVLLVSLGFIKLLRQLGRSYAMGLAASVTFVGLYYSLSYWHRAQTDGWAMFFCLASLLPMTSAWHHGPGRPRYCLMALSGAFLAVAFAFKYTIAVLGLVVFAPAIVGNLGNFHWRDLAWYVAGGLFVLTAIVTLMAGLGGLAPYLEIQSYIMGYVGSLTPKQNHSLVSATQSFTKITLGAPMVAIPLLVGFALLLLNVLRRRATELHAVILISLLAATASVVSQGKFFTYHYLPFLLPLPITIALTADAMIEQVNREARSVLKKTSAIMVVVAMLILPYQTAFTKSLRNVIIEVNDGDDKLHWALHNMPPDFNFIETVAAAEEIAELQKPDDKIFVWGYETLLYFLLERPPSYRYPYAWPLVVDFYDGRYTHDLISRLEAKPPETFIVQFDDQTPHVTGHNHDSRDMLKKIPELLHFLDQNYSKVKTVPRFEIWRRNF